MWYAINFPFLYQVFICHEASSCLHNCRLFTGRISQWNNCYSVYLSITQMMRQSLCAIVKAVSLIQALCVFWVGRDGWGEKACAIIIYDNTPTNCMVQTSLKPLTSNTSERLLMTSQSEISTWQTSQQRLTAPWDFCVEISWPYQRL